MPPAAHQVNFFDISRSVWVNNIVRRPTSYHCFSWWGMTVIISDSIIYYFNKYSIIWKSVNSIRVLFWKILIKYHNFIYLVIIQCCAFIIIWSCVFIIIWSRIFELNLLCIENYNFLTNPKSIVKKIEISLQ